MAVLGETGLTELITLIKNKLAGYLPTSGGTVSGNLTVTGTITGDVTGDVTGNASTATSATNADYATSAGTAATATSATTATTATSATSADSATKATQDGNGNVITSTYLPLSGGTMTGNISFGSAFINKSTDDSYLYVNGSTGSGNGAQLMLSGKSNTNAGAWWLTAHNGTISKQLTGKSDGTLTWGGNNVLTDATVGSRLSASISSAVAMTSTAKTITSKSLTKGVWVVTGHVYFTSVQASKTYAASLGTSANSVAYATDGSVVVHSSSTSGICIQVVRIFTLGSTTTVYLCGSSSANSNATNAQLEAVRIV